MQNNNLFKVSVISRNYLFCIQMVRLTGRLYVYIPFISRPPDCFSSLFFEHYLNWALSQRVDVSHVSTRLASSSSAWWTSFNAFGVSGITNNHITVNKNKGMMCNELERFQTKPLGTERRCRQVLQGCVIGTSERKIIVLPTPLCSSASSNSQNKNQVMHQSQCKKTNGWYAMNLNASKINLWALTKRANILFILELVIDFLKEAIAHKYCWQVSLLKTSINILY